MTHSPADILRQALVNAGVVIFPVRKSDLVPYEQLPGDASTLCFVSSMPNQPDQVAVICDGVGHTWGKLQRGKQITHPGFKILVRHLLYDEGYALANQIAVAVDSIYNQTVRIKGTSHYIQSVYRTGPITTMGEEPGHRRQLWSINGRIAFKDQEPSLG